MLKNKGKIITAAVGLMALNLALVGWVMVGKPAIEEGERLSLGQGEYDLTLTDGSRFTKDMLADGPTAVFFGFTFCPEVCPTTIGDILTWQEEVNAGDALNVVFVTVDPERDSLDVLDDYVSWAPGIRAATGSREEIDKAIAAFRIYAKKVPLEGGDYTMDHTASVMLFDAQGQFTETIGYQEETTSAADKIRKILPNAISS